MTSRPSASGHYRPPSIQPGEGPLTARSGRSHSDQKHPSKKTADKKYNPESQVVERDKETCSDPCYQYDHRSLFTGGGFAIPRLLFHANTYRFFRMMTGCFGPVAASQQFITRAAGIGQKRPFGAIMNRIVIYLFGQSDCSTSKITAIDTRYSTSSKLEGAGADSPLDEPNLEPVTIISSIPP